MIKTIFKVTEIAIQFNEKEIAILKNICKTNVAVPRAVSELCSGISIEEVSNFLNTLSDCLE